jgi:hypothetical protein
MKTVFNNSMLAHVWAHQTQEHGKSSGMAFYGPVIYSYRTPIAAIVKSATGQDIALITSNRYSITTSSRHMPEAYRAVRDLMPHFTVPDVGHSGGMTCACSTMADTHAVNLLYLVGEYHTYAAKKLRANDYPDTDQDNIEDALRLAAQGVIAYAEAFALALPKLPIADDAAKIYARRVRLTEKRNDPAYVAKCDANREKREELKRRKKEADILAAREAARENVAAWLAGTLETYRLGYGARLMPDGSAMLRVRGGDIETSLGATVPRAHVVRALALWSGAVAHGVAWSPGGRTVHLGPFALSGIDAVGNVRAGCHFISRAEVERIAALLSTGEKVQP